MSDFDSMLELAIELMEKKRKPHTIQSIAKDVFEMKGLKEWQIDLLFWVVTLIMATIGLFLGYKFY